MSDDVDDNLEFKRGVAQRRPNATTRAAMAEARTMDEKDAEIANLREEIEALTLDRDFWHRTADERAGEIARLRSTRLTS
jgi:hypothetical protein